TKQEVEQTYQRDTQACQAEYAQAKQAADDQLKKDQRRAKKVKEEAGWQALAVFEGTRDEGIKWRRQCEADWNVAIQDLEAQKYVIPLWRKKWGGLARAPPEETAALEAAAAAAPTPSPPAEPGAAPAASGDAGQEPGEAPSATEPARDDPLSRLQHDLARIDQERVAIDSLKMPKFLQVQVFIWPLLILGAGAAAGLALSAGTSWTVAGVAGAVVALATGIGARLGLASMARPHVLKHAVPLRKSLAGAEQLVEENKEWIKNEFDRKLKEFEQRRADKVRESEEKMASSVDEA